MSNDIAGAARQTTSYMKLLFASHLLSLTFDIHSRSHFQHMLTSKATSLLLITTVNSEKAEPHLETDLVTS